MTQEQFEKYLRWEEKMLHNYGFYVHALIDGVSMFKPGFCNIHTHGLNEIGHPEFRVVCDSNMDMKKLHKFISGMANDVIKNHERYVDQDILLITSEDDPNSTINCGYFINDIDEDNVLRLIRTYNISEELIRNQQLPLKQMMIGN